MVALLVMLAWWLMLDQPCTMLGHGPDGAEVNVTCTVLSW